MRDFDPSDILFKKSLKRRVGWAAFLYWKNARRLKIYFRSEISLNSNQICRMHSSLLANHLIYEDRKAEREQKGKGTKESPFLVYEVEPTEKKRRLQCHPARRMRRSSSNYHPRGKRETQCSDGPWESIVEVNKNLQHPMWVTAKVLADLPNWYFSYFTKDFDSTV